MAHSSWGCLAGSSKKVHQDAYLSAKTRISNQKILLNFLAKSTIGVESHPPCRRTAALTYERAEERGRLELRLLVTDELVSGARSIFEPFELQKPFGSSTVAQGMLHGIRTEKLWDEKYSDSPLTPGYPSLVFVSTSRGISAYWTTEPPVLLASTAPILLVLMLMMVMSVHPRPADILYALVLSDYFPNKPCNGFHKIVDLSTGQKTPASWGVIVHTTKSDDLGRICPTESKNNINIDTSHVLISRISKSQEIAQVPRLDCWPLKFLGRLFVCWCLEYLRASAYFDRGQTLAFLSLLCHPGTSHLVLESSSIASYFRRFTFRRRKDRQVPEGHGFSGRCLPRSQRHSRRGLPSLSHPRAMTKESLTTRYPRADPIRLARLNVPQLCNLPHKFTLSSSLISLVLPLLRF
ncbi:hypothetical protein KQX54_021791 [Cotesia glomerata]|uniref:Uncharacterized protein n=1 Tax=Cotesia glomerata TaxID=32391 RepID=A0AAV7JA03_COTGL|nr:hypothetical protein KQX54_021791 [Cotesia glomerata]